MSQRISSLLNSVDENVEPLESPVKRSRTVDSGSDSSISDGRKLPPFRETFSKNEDSSMINDNLAFAPFRPLANMDEAPFLLPDPSAYVPYYNPLNPRYTPPIHFTMPTLQINRDKPESMPLAMQTPPCTHELAKLGKEEEPEVLQLHSSPAPSTIEEQPEPEIKSSSTSFVFPAPHESYASGLFTLLEQPNSIQRKSYRKENRCLLPNPLIVCLGESRHDVHKKAPPEVASGTITLRLVNADGSELPAHKSHALESVEGGLTHNLDPDHTTCFSVKALQTSEGNLFRLIFDIKYTLRNGKQVEETIISKSFAVYSNKHNRNSRKTG